jgi:hypothetical protein
VRDDAACRPRGQQLGDSSGSVGASGEAPPSARPISSSECAGRPAGRRATRGSPRRSRRFGVAAPLVAHCREQLLEAIWIVERPDEREVQALSSKESRATALDVRGGHFVESSEEVVRVLDLALEYLAAQPILDRPCGLSKPEHEAPLRIAARFLELVRGNRLAAILRSSPRIVVTRLVDALDVDALHSHRRSRCRCTGCSRRARSSRARASRAPR